MEHGGVSLSTLENIDILNKFLADNPSILKEFERYKADY